MSAKPPDCAEMAPLGACLSIPETCERLGVCRCTTWRMMRRRRNPLPHVRLGRRVLVPEGALARWITRELERSAR